MGKTLSMMRANLAVQVEQQFSTHRHLLDWPTRDVEEGIIPTPENAVEFSAFQSQYIDIIPLSWTVLSVSLSESQDEIRVARVRSGQSPFILTLPLKRHNFRDPEEECFGFKVARDELQEIVHLANFSAHDAQDMTRKGARSEWWEVRAALDARLHELLCSIENVWLGGFRGIFSQTSHRSELLSRFQQSLQNILNKHLPSRQKQGRAKASGRIILDSRVLELFVGLGVPTEQNDVDELLMDLLYFVVDILQFHGEHNAYDEIDFDSVSFHPNITVHIDCF
jgi:separase